MPEDTPATPAAPRPPQPRNPLHGLTLEAIVKALVAYFGWQGLAEQIPVRCFSHEPSVASSLKFLRRTPWAREKVESLYLFMLREQARSRKHAAQWPAPTPEPLASLEPSEPPEAPEAPSAGA
jgi:uncharacterized protein (DUF2132 family)